MSRVLIIIAACYNGNELWPLLKALKRYGHTWTLASDTLVIREEGAPKAYHVDTRIDEVKYTHDGLVFISGNPQDTYAHWTDSDCNRLVRKAAKLEHPMAAICASVPALAPALRGVKVSAYPLQSVLWELEVAGAVYMPVSLYTDKNIATAENEVMGFMWAENFCCLLEGKPPKYVLKPSPFKRKGTSRRPITEVEYLRKQNLKKEDE